MWVHVQQVKSNPKMLRAEVTEDMKALNFGSSRETPDMFLQLV